MFLQPLAHRNCVLNIGGCYPRCLHLEFGLVSLFSSMIFQNFYLLVYFFLAALGLCCCAWAFSSCDAELLIVMASLAAEHGL